MAYYQTAATISLILQIVVLVLLFAGVGLKERKKFRQHGIVMLTAVVLHTITILVVMIPSFILGFSSPGSIDLANTLVVTTLVHAFVGIAALLLGVWLVASWRLRADMKTCFAKKGIMRLTITIWLIALFLGIFMYWNFYAPILFG
jgi:uncharacterized membrane protein YozB (DUF420 family)